MDRVTLTETEIMEALREALEGSQGPDDARTVAELQEATGWHVNRVRQGVKAMLAAGEAECVRVYRPGMDGRRAQVPGYRFTRGAGLRVA